MLGINIWKVAGRSMAPSIPPSSYILSTQWLNFFSLKEGQYVVIKHPKYGVIVKTVAIVDRNGFLWSKGENKESMSVERLGPVDKAAVLGRVIHIFKPKREVT